MAQVPEYPTKLFFFCEVEPAIGGETPIVLSHVVYERMKDKYPDFVDKLEKHGVIYTRVLGEEDDPSSPIGRGWKSTFLTTHKSVAEERSCLKMELLSSWTCQRKNGNFVIAKYKSQVAQHFKDGYLHKDEFKIVYVAPMKALAAEVTSTFSHRLAPLNVTLRELTGDMQLSKNELEETQMIVTTPEKWDVITRKSSDMALSMLVKSCFCCFNCMVPFVVFCAVL